ncbi:MAG: MmcQ/YjbR family DNA-binding protein [Flavobacteriaceae bacterium]
MQIDQLHEYCLKKKAVTEAFPFDNDVLVFKVAGKIFALMSISKWEAGEGHIYTKCNPDYALELRETYESIVPAWHMSKKHWNSLLVYKNELPPKFILKLIDDSYELVVKGLPKKIRDLL